MVVELGGFKAVEVFCYSDLEHIGTADGKDTIDPELMQAAVIELFAADGILRAYVKPIYRYHIMYGGARYPEYDDEFFYTRADAVYQVIQMRKTDGLDVHLKDIIREKV